MTKLTWDGCLNVRDLGGLPTEDGRSTRAGVLVRADNVQGLTPVGWDALVAYGIRRVVDLRLADELNADRTRTVPSRAVPVEIVHVSVLDGWSDELKAHYDARIDASPTAEPYFVWSYLDFLERFHAQFVAAVTAIADAPAGGVVVHCAGGKDRTGLVSALVLRHAGVATDVVAADYALTEANLLPRLQPWIDSAPNPDEARRRHFLQATTVGAMTGVVEGVETRHGSVTGYLRAGGATTESLERLRGRLLGAS